MTEFGGLRESIRSRAHEPSRAQTQSGLGAADDSQDDAVDCGHGDIVRGSQGDAVDGGRDHAVPGRPSTGRLRRAGSALTEGMRTLNRLTLGADDQLTCPADVCEVLASLALAVSELPQLVEQLATFLEIEAVKGSVRAPQGADSGTHISTVSDALHRVGLDAEAMRAALAVAGDACGSLRSARVMA